MCSFTQVRLVENTPQVTKGKMFECRFDPDILVGYEVQMRSWGYLLQRAAVLGVDLCQQLSRVPGLTTRPHKNMSVLSAL